MAARAGDRVGMAARHDMQDALFVRNLGHGERERRVDVAEQEVDLVALDQLARLLHRGARVAAGRILDDEFNRAAENAALGVDLIERQLAADQFVLAWPGVSAGQRIVEADPDRVRGAGANDKGAGDLRGGEHEPRFDDSATVHADARIGLGHGLLLPGLRQADNGRSARFRARPADRLLIMRHFRRSMCTPSSAAGRRWPAPTRGIEPGREFCPDAIPRRSLGPCGEARKRYESCVGNLADAHKRC